MAGRALYRVYELLEWAGKELLAANELERLGVFEQLVLLWWQLPRQRVQRR